MSGTTPDRVAAVRSFNRFYTRRIGVLGDGLLGTAFPLPQARVLFELGQRDVTEVADLRRMLGMDRGYLSRLLARLEEAGLLARERSGTDARRQQVRLTRAGARAHARLDARSATENRALLEGLGDAEQRRVLGAMTAIEGLLGAGANPPAPVLRAPGPGDFGWIVERHGALYAEEYRWDATFESLVARIVADHVERHDPECEAAWIAEVDGRPAGCVLCVREEETVAKLRLLLVEPWARGMGIGARLVDECIAFATGAGYASLTLWTNHPLRDARRLYERAGFQLVAEKPHHSFGHDLVGQDWSRALRRD
jgi:DNA-binding MarR family transcriptional regulator/N-acetylglutamate synthase-like GNAT family acetyltransferase